MNLETRGIIFSQPELETMGLPDENPFPYAHVPEFYHLAKELQSAHTELGNYEAVDILKGIVGPLGSLQVSSITSSTGEDCPDPLPYCPQFSRNAFALRMAIRRHGFWAEQE